MIRREHEGYDRDTELPFLLTMMPLEALKSLNSDNSVAKVTASGRWSESKGTGGPKGELVFGPIQSPLKLYEAKRVLQFSIPFSLRLYLLSEFDNSRKIAFNTFLDTTPQYIRAQGLIVQGHNEVLVWRLHLSTERGRRITQALIV